MKNKNVHHIRPPYQYHRSSIKKEKVQKKKHCRKSTLGFLCHMAPFEPVVVVRKNRHRI